MWCDWRGGRVAESTGLLNLHTGNGITSSNLVLSAESGPADICRATLFKSALNRALKSNVYDWDKIRCDSSGMDVPPVSL